MVQIPFEKLLYILVAETLSRRKTVFLFFAVISLSLLAVGSLWPKKYTSYSIIQIEDSNILQPLMRGAAETTQTIDQSTNAREIIFGEKIMGQILDEVGLLENEPTKIEQERIKASIKERVDIRNTGENLLRIEYEDSIGERAFLITKRMSELFIKEGEKAKIAESQAAYGFIEKQVNEYLEKLTLVEEKLRAFRTDNPDSRPELETEVSTRISQLQTNIEQNRLLLRETLIKKESFMEQLSGEAAVTISLTREGRYRTKIAELQEDLDTLRLDYHETYPDIVQLKNQITDLKEALKQEHDLREEAKGTGVNRSSRYPQEIITQNPLYQQLRSDLSNTETEIATLRARINELENMLQVEYERAKKIHGGEMLLSNLTRNYQVNQEIYQDLLRRLENARVSKNLDEEQKGLTYKIQEPAKIPFIPTGIRFIHFMIAGMFLGIAVPIGLIYIMLKIDPRIRFSQVISTELGIPVIAEINAFVDTSASRKETRSNIFIFIGVSLVFLIYGYVTWLKYIGEL